MERCDFQQQSVSSVSSHDSDSDLIKQMPILKMSYSPALSIVKKKDCSNFQMKALSGGDVLFGFDSQNTQEQPAILEHRNSINLSQANDDVVDSVFTRSGKQEILFDHNGTKDCIEKNPVEHSKESENSIQPSSENTETKKRPRHVCCSVFCTLFKCENFFTRYTIFDFTLNIGSIGVYLFVLVTDWVNALGYYYRRDEDPDNLFYFGLTVFVIVLPSIVMHFFSAWWEIEDNRLIKKQKKDNNMKANLGYCYCLWAVLFHLLQVAPIYRYLRTISFGLKSRYEEVCGREDRWSFYDRKYKGELLDVNFIRLMESFLEAAPLLVLQIFIMIHSVQTPTITVLAVCASLVGMSTSFLAYERVLRNTLKEKDQLSVLASIVLLLYRSLTVMSRVISLALLLNTNVWAWIGFFVIRWCVMSLLIACHKTQFCATKAKEYIYDAVIGFCYIFAYFNVHSEKNKPLQNNKSNKKNRYRMLAYYILTFFENIAMAICWFYLRRGGGSLINAFLGTEETSEETLEGALSTEIALALVVSVIVLYLLGMLFFFIYYIALHPKARGAGLCIPGESNNHEQVKNSALRLRSPCGNNYRTNRNAPQFRSWHSASLRFDPGEINKSKRPASEIISPSPSMLYDFIPQHDTPKNDLIASSCSCYSVGGASSRSKQILEEKKPSPANRTSTSSYAMAVRDSQWDDDAEMKRQQVFLLLEEKQKRKREIEQQLSLVTRQQRDEVYVQKDREVATTEQALEMQDLFNRKTRALHLYSPRSATPSSDVSTAVTLVPLRPSDPFRSPVSSISSTRRSRDCDQLQTAPASSSTAAASSNNDDIHRIFSQSRRSRAISSGSGTFPRTARSQHTGRSAPTYKRPGSLKTIREDRTIGQLSAVRRNTTSLVNLGQSRPGKSVPRTMSCTISHDEVIEAIESSL